MKLENNTFVELAPETVIIPEGRRTTRTENIDDLVDDIKRHGQLQNIVIRSDGTLRAGCRRTLACIQLEKPVKAFVNDDGDDLEIEAAENNIRQGASFSEKVAYTKAMRAKLEDEIGERRGRPSPLKDNCADSPQFPKGVKSRDYVASLCGWGSKYEMELGLKIAEKGHEDLIAALDAGNIKSLAQAEEIAVARKGMQIKMVRRLSAKDSMPTDDFKRMVAEERAEKKNRFEKRLSQRAAIAKNKGKYQYIYAHPRTGTETNNLPDLDIDIVANERCIIALKLGHCEIGIAHQCFTNWGISDIEIVQVVGNINLPTTTVVEQESYLLVFGIRGKVTPVKKLPAFIVEDKEPLHSTVHKILRDLQPTGWLDMFGTKAHYGFALAKGTEQEGDDDQADE